MREHFRFIRHINPFLLAALWPGLDQRRLYLGSLAPTRREYRYHPGTHRVDFLLMRIQERVERDGKGAAVPQHVGTSHSRLHQRTMCRWLMLR